MSTPKPCPDCGNRMPTLWGDADPLRLLGVPVTPYLYIACDRGAERPNTAIGTRRNPGVEQDGREKRVMTERERIAALEEQIDVLADRLRGIGITAERDVERALAALGKRNRPPVDGQGGMTIDKGVGGEAAKPRGRPPINDEGGTATTKGSGDFLRWEREGWVHHATRMANERDEAQAERDALAKALRDMLDLHDPDGEWRREHDENSDGHWPYQSGSDALAAALRMTVFSNGENSLPEAVAMRLEVAHSVLETYDGRSK